MTLTYDLDLHHPEVTNFEDWPSTKKHPNRSIQTEHTLIITSCIAYQISAWWPWPLTFTYISLLWMLNSSRTPPLHLLYKVSYKWFWTNSRYPANKLHGYLMMWTFDLYPQKIISARSPPLHLLYLSVIQSGACQLKITC